MSISGLTEKSASLSYRVSYHILPNTTASLPTSQLVPPTAIEAEVEVTLARKCTTRPVDHPDSGEEFRFAAFRIARGVNTNNEKPAFGSDFRVVEGELKVPPGEINIQTCGGVIQVFDVFVSVLLHCSFLCMMKHLVTAHVTSPSLLSPLTLTVPVVLPQVQSNM